MERARAGAAGGGASCSLREEQLNPSCLFHFRACSVLSLESERERERERLTWLPANNRPV